MSIPITKPARRYALFAICASLVLQLAAMKPVWSGEFMDQFIDKEDGWFDGSDWVLDNATGFMPVPIIITEPAVGNGLGLAAAFFHPPEDYESDATASTTDQRKNGQRSGRGGESEFVLPDVSVVAAAITENDTWFVGGGHIAHWKDDHIRFEGVAGYASINTTFYGFAEGPQIDRGIQFNAEGLFLDAPVAFRIKGSNFFLGGGYGYTAIDTTTDFSSLLPPGFQGPNFGKLNLDTILSSVEVFAQYDGRDNVFTPNSGANGEISVSRNDEAIGSDWDFTRIKVVGYKYVPAGDTVVVGLRGDYAQVNGALPFFAVPFISLRGIPALRYQGENVLVGEVEVRWDFHPRVSAVGFLGAGKAAGSISDMNDEPTRVTRGIGIRYLGMRKLGMRAGIDVAKGPDDTYWYLTVGSAW